MRVKSVVPILIAISACLTAVMMSGCDVRRSNENLEVIGISLCDEAETFINSENSGLETIRSGYIHLPTQCYADFMAVLLKVSNQKCRLSESQPSCNWESSGGHRQIIVFSETPTSMTITNGVARPDKLIWIDALN